ncbi:MAG: thioredoxin [Clostridiales bacterium]|nr:thioredoxin [Clostridiales bacterium]
MSVRISKDNFGNEVLESDKLVIADFYSDSCVPCKRIAPLLAEVEEENKDSVKLVKVNINFDSELAHEFEVQSSPTLVFFKNGEEKSRLTGLVNKSEISDIINDLR